LNTVVVIDSRWEALSDQLVIRCCIDRLSWQGFSECGFSVGCLILAVFARVGIFGPSISKFRDLVNLNHHPLKPTKGGAPKLPSHQFFVSAHTAIQGVAPGWQPLRLWRDVASRLPTRRFLENTAGRRCIASPSLISSFIESRAASHASRVKNRGSRDTSHGTRSFQLCSPPPAPASFCCFSRCSLRRALRDRRILLPSMARTLTRT
jgi:hypothetical protein